MTAPHAYILQNPDGRIVFAIPYEHDFTLIGTTDVPYAGAPGAVAISDAGDGLSPRLRSIISCAAPVTRDDIVWSYAGLRPLYDDGSLNASVVTRDYAFDLDAPEGRRLVLSVFGGKITTARRLAEHALDDLAPLPAAAWRCMDGGRRLPRRRCGFRGCRCASRKRKAVPRRRRSR